MTENRAERRRRTKRPPGAPGSDTPAAAKPGRKSASAAKKAAKQGAEAVTLAMFAVTAPGLEKICAAELAELGIAGTVVDGGVEWQGDLRSLYRANLESRVASRILVRLGTFRARSFMELERRAPKLPWRSLLRAGTHVELRVTSRKSRLYHQRAVAERFTRVLLADHRIDAASSNAGEDDETGDAQLVVIRLVRDVCTVSIDASGALLHQRGYRQALAKAPLRETIAAALLHAAGWHGQTALADPMCGSGTIPIEAALLARRIAPGIASAGNTPRSYAFEKWNGFDSTVWGDVVEAARSLILPSAGVPIVAADRNAGAITATRTNAERAGVAEDLIISRAGISSLTAPAPQGMIVTNPPYGVRVGERAELRPLYATLGRVAREQFAGWDMALLAADQRLVAATQLALTERLATRNGGISVRLLATSAGTDAPTTTEEEPT